jgi:hypothetical protein
MQAEPISFLMRSALLLQPFPQDLVIDKAPGVLHGLD